MYSGILHAIGRQAPLAQPHLRITRDEVDLVLSLLPLFMNQFGVSTLVY